jgi:hypothetical protein
MFGRSGRSGSCDRLVGSDASIVAVVMSSVINRKLAYNQLSQEIEHMGPRARAGSTV